MCGYDKNQVICMNVSNVLHDLVEEDFWNTNHMREPAYSRLNCQLSGIVNEQLYAWGTPDC